MMGAEKKLSCYGAEEWSTPEVDCILVCSCTWLCDHYGLLRQLL